MYASVMSAAMVGVEPRPVNIEVMITPSGRAYTAFRIVGLPDAAVRESCERVRSAIMRQGYRFPDGRVVVSLGPAGIPKVGTVYDLPIALAILAASLDDPIDFAPFVAVGELSLDGSVRPVASTLAALDVARGVDRRCLVPHSSPVPPRWTSHLAGVQTLGEAVAVARGVFDGRQVEATPAPALTGPDLAHVKGQTRARRALEIAAAGGHHLLMSGPPGAGKTLMARTLPSVLPPLTASEQREVALIGSVVGSTIHGDRPPFRAPHHSASTAALVGGGIGIPKPGEVTRAHRGVLFLDELGEFPPASIDALRQPLEDGTVTVARSVETVQFPARLQLVAATNPCPCGYDGDRRRPCSCTDAAKARYRSKLSGPLVDRFDLRITVPRLPLTPTDTDHDSEGSDIVRRRVEAARERQRARGGLNRELSGSELDAEPFVDGAVQVLQRAAESEALTGRGWDRVRRVARTIADLAGVERIDGTHVEEALDLRLGVA